jgi:hypothetical protein
MIFALIICAIVIGFDLQETARNRQRIGETVVICGDTLTIDDYNVSYKYYILSNGLIYECK